VAWHKAAMFEKSKTSSTICWRGPNAD
jgi:hypothetical protein